ncbi:cadmium-translocating P-type ATPase [Candidatus Chloroploca sp. M-50]|uniref:Cadmium-translocating P-type ATPase n=1 Tax=Candidatus Chloroploca mongolica TaxID=2528176 RepID=A0ABS4DEB9_9CHLR|nr:heavy metal translocating P-type ATPase [Candidatus Chloroploca mongolica]MBP1467797.1 cadmium-translocating P-type ATPase [Candidatus Chloroploca mongolica]
MITLSTSRPETKPERRLQFDATFVEQLFVVLTLVGIVVGVLLERVEAAPGLLLTVRMATYFVGGFFAVIAIIKALRERTIEVDLLMVLAALGAAYVDAWTEGAILLFLFSLSNVLQNYAMNRTRSAISSLLELRPDTVTIRRDGELEEVPLEAIVPGDLVVLRPGDRVPLDGVIMQGTGNFDESAITGESMPVQKGVGATILAGTLNQSGAIDMQVAKTAEESTLARIIGMVSDAQARKAQTQSFLDRAEQWYAMGVIATVALFILLVPPIFGVNFSDNFYRGMVLLTVASPCALVISVPAALLSAIANAARKGVLFKGGAHLEELSRVKVIAFDKTGTLTYGRPEVTDILPQPGVTAHALLVAVARAEYQSEHPIARAILAYAEAQGLETDEPEAFEAVTGMGVRATWDGEETLVGAPKLFAHAGLSVPQELLDEVDRLALEGRGTVLLAARGGHWLGLITVMDRERPDAAAQLAELRAAGIERIVMLTGDNERVAEALGRRLGIDEVHASLMPEDKLRIVEDLGRRYGPTAMVGDGVNDAPALAAAASGIAMGAAGTDAALETADIVLMRDDLSAIAYAVKLSKRTQRIVWQNISFALTVVVVLVIATLTIGIPLPLGVVGHEGSTIIVVLNGLRLLAHR